jgi:membrane-associated protein
MIHHLFDIPYLVSTYGYIGIFVIIFLESGIFFPLPGDSLLFTAGIVGPLYGLRVSYVVLLALVAAFFGGMAGYIIGLYIEKLHRFAFFRKILKPEYILRTHTFFERHGRAAIIISRFVPVVRTFAPIAAGIGRMSVRKFLLSNLLSAIIWTVTVTLVGYGLGKRFPQVGNYLHYLAAFIILVSILPGVFGWLRHRRSKVGE